MKLNTKTFNNSTNIEFPGFYEFIKFDMLSKSGKKQDLRDKIVQFDFFESIWSTAVSGKIVIVDTENLISSFPIVGEETVQIEVLDSISRKRYELNITHISDRQQLTPGSLGYTLHLSSRELFADSFLRVSKSYIQSKYEDNVKDIMIEYLQSEKHLHLAETESPKQVIIPNWSPLYACSWLANRAQAAESKYQNGNFIFYETQSGFYFVSLENLFDSAENKVYCEFEPRPLRQGKKNAQNPDALTKKDPRFTLGLLQFENWKITKTFDVLENIRSGMYANRIYEFDVVKREIKTKNYSYIDSFDEQIHLKSIDNKKAFPSNSNQFDPNRFPEANQRVVLNHKGLFTADTASDADGSNVSKWLSEKISQIVQLENQVITGHLPGHLDLEAGMIVNFYVPEVKNISGTKRLHYDEAISGEYLITSVRRMFHVDKMWLVVEMVKDARGVSA